MRAENILETKFAAEVTVSDSNNGHSLKQQHE